MALPKEEQETVVNFLPSVGEVVVSTSYPPHSRQPRQLGVEPYEVSKVDGKDAVWTFKMPLDRFKLPRPKRKRTVRKKAEGQA